MIALNYRQSYSCELVESCGHFALSEASQRANFAVLAAFSCNEALLLRGPACCGKSETFKTLARVLAKPCFAWFAQHDYFTAGGGDDEYVNGSSGGNNNNGQGSASGSSGGRGDKANSSSFFNGNNNNADGHNFGEALQTQMVGAAMGGYWLLLENLERLSAAQMKLLGAALFHVRNAFASEKRTLLFQGMQLELPDYNNSTSSNVSWGLCLNYGFGPNTNAFSSVRSSGAKYYLPVALLENCRTCNFAPPDFVVVIAAFLQVNNFVQPEETARRLVFFL